MLDALVLGLVGLNVYAVLLVVARAVVFRTRLYRPMLLNVGLSLAPGALMLLMGLFVLLAPPLWLALPVLVLLGLAWLLLLPNAGYLVTELNMSHRQPDDSVPMWFDVLLLITLATSGVVNTVASLFVAHMLFGVVRHGDLAVSMLEPDAVAFVVVILLLVAFGVFIGRHVRVNSWDVLRPWRLVRTVVRGLADTVGSAVAFTLMYATFLGLMYVVVAGSVIRAAIELGF